MSKPLSGSRRVVQVVEAGKTFVFPTGGSTFLTIESMVGEMRLEIPGTSGFRAYAGFEYRAEPDEQFDSVSFTNEGASDIALAFYIGFGRIRDHSLRVVDQGNGLKIKSPDGISTSVCDDVLATATPIFSANPATRFVRFYNPDAAKTLWVGDSSVGVGRGIPVAPQTLSADIESSDAIYGISSSGTITAVKAIRFFFR